MGSFCRISRAICSGRCAGWGHLTLQAGVAGFAPGMENPLLRSGLALAGAKRELMEDFYGRILRGEGRAETLRQAQLQLKRKYPDPFYWGAFICQGEPGPLS
jgi:hypothetical protein